MAAITNEKSVVNKEAVLLEIRDQFIAHGGQDRLVSGDYNSLPMTLSLVHVYQGMQPHIVFNVVNDEIVINGWNPIRQDSSNTLSADLTISAGLMWLVVTDHYFNLGLQQGSSDRLMEGGWRNPIFHKNQWGISVIWQSAGSNLAYQSGLRADDSWQGNPSYAGIYGNMLNANTNHKGDGPLIDGATGTILEMPYTRCRDEFWGFFRGINAHMVGSQIGIPRSNPAGDKTYIGFSSGGMLITVD
jgi:hypothetical protein